MNTEKKRKTISDSTSTTLHLKKHLRGKKIFVQSSALVTICRCSFMCNNRLNEDNKKMTKIHKFFTAVDHCDLPTLKLDAISI